MRIKEYNERQQAQMHHNFQEELIQILKLEKNDTRGSSLMTSKPLGKRTWLLCHQNILERQREGRVSRKIRDVINGRPLNDSTAA